MPVTLFVGGLDRQGGKRDDKHDKAAQERLSRYFSQFGAFPDDTPPRALVHRGFGLVAYVNHDAAAAAIAAVQGAAGVHDEEGLLCKHAEIAKDRPPTPPRRSPSPPPPPAAANPEWECCNIAITMVPSHQTRVCSYMKNFGLRFLAPDLSQKASSGTMLCMMRAEQDPAEAAEAIISDKLLGRALRKVFVLQEGLWFADLDSALQRLVTMLTAATEGSEQRAKVRVQVHPFKAVAQVVEKIDAIVGGDGHQYWELAPQNASVVASVVLAGDGYRIGVSGQKSFAGHMPTHAAAADPICRAYFKLREAVIRSETAFDFRGAIAIDAGAAPGGWTKYLLERGCSRVYAVDPANLGLDPLPEGARHVRAKIQDALPVIGAELAAEGRQLDVFVSDLCPHNREELVEVGRAVLSSGILRSRGLVVLTFKMGMGHSEATWDKLAREDAARLDEWLEDCQLIHLVANRSRERTLVGYTKPRVAGQARAP